MDQNCFPAEENETNYHEQRMQNVEEMVIAGRGAMAEAGTECKSPNEDQNGNKQTKDSGKDE